MRQRLDMTISVDLDAMHQFKQSVIGVFGHRFSDEPGYTALENDKGPEFSDFHDILSTIATSCL